MAVSFIPFALLSGFFAALSSTFAKLFTDEQTANFINIVFSYFPSIFKLYSIDEQTILLITRVICFSLIFGCNSIMWTLFTKALNLAPSSVQVTTVNGAMNLSTSAILGYLVFGEPLALRWWIGASFILAGTIMISRSQKEIDDNKKKD